MTGKSGRFAIFMSLILVMGIVTVPASVSGEQDDSMLTIYLSGSNEERGLRYGAAAADEIEDNLGKFWDGIASRGYSKNELLIKALENEGTQPAEMLEELRGMARGAGVDYNELLAMNMYGTLTGGVGGCTQFVAVGDSTVDGKVIASKNRDESGVNVLIIVEPTDERHGIIAVTEAGYWGISFGLNELGVCDGNNWMPIPNDAFYEGGLTELNMNRIVLERCGSVDEAIALVDELPKYGGSTLMVADSIEGAFVETVPSDGSSYWLNPSIPDMVAKKIVNGIDCHTNHYQYEPFYSMVIEDAFGYVWTPSVARYDNGVRLMEEAGYVVTPEQIISFCRDLENFGLSHPNEIKDAHPEIPWHSWSDGWPGFSICNIRTVSSGVFVLDDEHPDLLSTMWTSIYNPCWSPYTPLHNAMIREPELFKEELLPFRDGTAWLASMKLRAALENDWGVLVPIFEEWEQSIRESLDENVSHALILINNGQIDEAAWYLTQRDCGYALLALDLMVDLGAWISGNYAENNQGNGLRAAEIGTKVA